MLSESISRAAPVKVDNIELRDVDYKTSLEVCCSKGLLDGQRLHCVPAPARVRPCAVGRFVQYVKERVRDMTDVAIGNEIEDAVAVRGPQPLVANNASVSLHRLCVFHAVCVYLTADHRGPIP